MAFDTRTKLPPPPEEPQNTPDTSKMMPVLQKMLEQIVSLSNMDEREKRLETKIDTLNDAIHRFADALGSVDSFKEATGYLKQIAEKEPTQFPEIPGIPDFPKFPESIKISNQTPVDLSVTNALLAEVIVLLGKLGSAPRSAKPVIVQMQSGPALTGAESIGSGMGKRHSPKLIPETPTGAINGSNKVFFASRNPKFGTNAILFLNGAYQKPGVDFSFSGNKITYTQAPVNGDTQYILFMQ